MIGEMAIYNALDAEIMLSNITAENRNQEEATIYLKALKFALESQILNKLVDLEQTDKFLGKDNSTEMFHRRAWICLGMPKIDDIGQKIVEELAL